MYTCKKKNNLSTNNYLGLDSDLKLSSLIHASGIWIFGNYHDHDFKISNHNDLCKFIKKVSFKQYKSR